MKFHRLICTAATHAIVCYDVMLTSPAFCLPAILYTGDGKTDTFANKLEFHDDDTDTDTDILADFLARILARK